MKRTLLFIILALCSATASTAQELMPDDTSGDYRQHASWELVAGPNITTHIMHTDALQDEPDRTAAAPGLDAGFILNYHISPRWTLQLATIGTVERLTLTYGDDISRLNAFGFDVTMPACYSINGKKGCWTLFAGVFAHFTTGSSTDNTMYANPYNRSSGTDIRTGNDTYALENFYGGLACGTSYKISDKLSLQLCIQMGCTNLLNSSSHGQLILPLKSSLHLGYNLD